MRKDFMEIDALDAPLSESNVSLKLAEIQMRCWELLDDDKSLELTLEEPVKSMDDCNPYDRG